MFGAYQAGVWRALSGRFRPDIVIGASSGALNAWAIAGGCGPDQLAEFWLDPALADVTHLRFPFPLWDGVFDSDRLDALARRVHSAFRPQTEIAVAATAVRGLRVRLFRNEEITWRHLAASCSIAFGFRPGIIDRRLYTDGGLLGALPLWATREVGATSALAVLSMPRLPSAAGGAVLRLVRALAPATSPASVEARTIEPSEPMGTLRDLMFWRRSNVERWLALGERDAETWLAESLTTR
jgi:predicted acylesterase/phospholipase RssA